MNFKEIGEGRILFQFFHRLDHKRVVEGGPWSIGSHPLIIHQMRVGEVPHSVPLNKILFWVQIYNLPMGCFSEKVGRMLGDFIGTFVEYVVSNKGVAWKPFMRIRMELDVNLPLKRGKKIRTGMGSSSTVTFKYERLQLFCFICGKLGHTESGCEVLFESDEGNIRKDWGPFLKAPERRAQFSGGDRWLRGENDEKFYPVEKSSENPTTGGGAVNIDDGGNIVDQVNEIVTVKDIFLGQLSINRDNRDMDNILKGTLIRNPCFEFISIDETEGSDDCTLTDIRKRK